ncbi:DUF2515 domain-containing protein [Paenibacillus sp. NEAU-GSW1]|nr:DUF2515 domain-containing protein [Paenibacillus sp. NEAU-GSW1]
MAAEAFAAPHRQLGLRLMPEAVSSLSAAWRQLPQTSPQQHAELSGEELALIERIQSETSSLNRNNVTRAEAYRLLFNRYPELEWAMLAHFVSRNGGWNMTDIQGDWLPRLLNEQQRRDLFHFLERSNALIFHDAYPQLLLYEHSLKQQQPLFHLLPAFGVSRFMAPVWTAFWRERDPVPLTVALIVNEQNYIEKRVVQQPYFRKRVIDTLFFNVLPWLQLNAVLLPYQYCGETRLAGLVIERFQSLHERIEFGKRLYAVLFGVPRVAEGALAFAGAIPHSGSRSDYLPDLFSTLRQPEQQPYSERLAGAQLRPGAPAIYSPELADAWPDQPFAPSEPGDWFERAEDVEPYFCELPLPPSFELTSEYSLLLKRIELTVLLNGGKERQP